MNLTVWERLNDGSRSTSPHDYGDYVRFFNLFRPLVAELAPVGNRADSDFTSACHQLVDADGGLPGNICLRDHGMMTAQVSASYLRSAVDTFSNVYSGMVREGFVFGKRKLVHQSMDMFALPPDENGCLSFVVADRGSSNQPCIFTFEPASRTIAAVEIREGISTEEPHVTYDVRTGQCRLSLASVADNELERGLNLLGKAKEIFCGRKIDFETYAALSISENFSMYEALGVSNQDRVDPSARLEFH